MAISAESQQVLAELQKAGVDPAIVAGLQRELDTKPNADKATGNMLLAQNSFNSYKSKKELEINELRNNLQKLSGLQGAAGNLDGDLKKAALEQITALENLFVAQGFSLEEVREEAAKMTSDPDALKKLVDDKEKEGKKEMPTNENGKNLVDSETLAKVLMESGNNIAMGGMVMATEIAKAMRKADQLGIPLTDDQINALPEVIAKGFEAKLTADQAIDKHFGFSTKLAEVDKTKREAEIADAYEKGKREASKEKGVHLRKIGDGNNEHPLYGRGYGAKEKKPEERKRFQEVTQEDIDKLPKNSQNEPELFRLRRNDEIERRTAHTENAVERWEKEKQNFSDEGEFIGHLNRQSV